jgi:hypothetical protein
VNGSVPPEDTGSSGVPVNVASGSTEPVGELDDGHNHEYAEMISPYFSLDDLDPGWFSD